MTTYPLGEIPLDPATEKFTLQRKQSISQSAFTGVATVINNFSQWQLQVGFAPVLRGSSDERQMMSWLVSLRGSEGSFLYYPADAGKAITGKTLGAPGYAESNSILITGFTGSSPTGLAAGDYFSIGHKLFIITQAPVNATSGNATISFEPPLRADIAPGATINFVTPNIELRLAGGNDDGQGYSKDPAFTYFNSLIAVEVLE